MHIRLAAPEDAPQLAELRWDFRCEYEAPPAPTAEARAEFLSVCTEFIRAGLACGRWAAWVAEEEGLIVSQLFLQRIPKIPKLSNLAPEFGYITNVYTRPEWRGRGIGAQVMQQTKDWARAEGLEMLVLWPAEGREAFYQRAGFHPDESLELDFK